jgi:hypothetical protein
MNYMTCHWFGQIAKFGKMTNIQSCQQVKLASPDNSQIIRDTTHPEMDFVLNRLTMHWLGGYFASPNNLVSSSQKGVHC